MQKLFSFFIALFIGCNTIAQVNLDSLWGVWNDQSQPDTNRLKAMQKIAWHGYLFSQPDSAFYFAQIEYDLANSVNNKKFMAIALNTQGVSFYLQSKYEESLNYQKKCLKIKEELGDKKEISSSYLNIGNIYFDQGNYDEALSYFKKCLKIREEIGDQKGISTSLNNIGMIYHSQSNYEEALNYYKKSLNIYEEIGDKKGIAMSFSNIGVIYKDQSNYEDALIYNKKSLNIREEIGDKNGIATSFLNIGNIYKDQGNYEDALIYNKKSLKIKEEIGEKYGISTSLNNIGNIYKDQGNYEEAFNYQKKSLNIREEIGDKNGIAHSLINIAGIYSDQGNYEDALIYNKKSLKIFEEIGDKKGVVESLLNIGNIYKNHRDYDKAIEFYKRGLIISEKINNKKSIAVSLNAIGLIHENQGKYNEALDYYNKSLMIQQEIGNLHGIAHTYNNIGVLYKEQKDYQKSMDYYMKSLKICEEIGAGTITSNILGNIGMLLYLQNNYQQAQDYAHRSLALAKKVNALENIEFNSNLLYLIYKKTHKDSKALEMLELYNETKDTLAKMDLNDLLLKQKVQQEYEVKIYKDSIDNIIEINNKNEKIAKTDAALKSKRSQQLFLLIGLGLVLVFSVFIFNRFRVTNRQKKVIQGQHQELEQNHTVLEEVHKDITDSIVYAKRIQDATLTSISYIKEVLPQSFLYFNPKELVSGDFYWVFKNADDVFFTVADCTGHGVPGAFMSMIGNSLLNEMIIENNLKDTNLIMDKVSDKVKESLDQKGEQGESRDGMDMMLCKLNKKTNELMYTGAKNPLYLIREGELIEYKGDKRPVGYYTGENILFTSKKISLKKNDVIYLFSDGFSDQFGGKTAKKYKAANFKRFLLSISDKEMDIQHQLLSDEFDSWKGDLEQIDDVCVMGVRV